jgi:hypothetical protein
MLIVNIRLFSLELKNHQINRLWITRGILQLYKQWINRFFMESRKLTFSRWCNEWNLKITHWSFNVRNSSRNYSKSQVCNKSNSISNSRKNICNLYWFSKSCIDVNFKVKLSEYEIHLIRLQIFILSKNCLFNCDLMCAQNWWSRENFWLFNLSLCA